MFEPGLPVHHHPDRKWDVVVLRRDHEVLPAGDVRHPLALVAARLQVLLERGRAPGRQPVDVLLCDLVAGQVVLARGVAAVEGVARGVGPGSHDRARTDHFGAGEDVLRPHRIVEVRGHPVGEVDRRLEVALRDEALVLAVVVGVHVDEAGDDGLAGHVHGPVGPGGVAFPDARDAAALDEQGCVLVHGTVVEGDDAGVREGERSFGDDAVDAQPDGHGVGLAGRGVVDEEVLPAPEFEAVVVEPARVEAAFGGELRDGDRGAPLLERDGVAAHSAGGQGCPEDVVALLEGDAVAAGRDDELVAPGDGRVHLRVGAVTAHRHQSDRSLSLARVVACRQVDAPAGAERRPRDLAAVAEQSTGSPDRNGHDALLRSSFRGDAPQLPEGVLRGRPGARCRPAPSRDHDLGTIERPHGVGVLGGRSGELLGGAASGRNLPHVPAIFAAPGRVRDPAAVGRPRG